jgi:hypothetical protein
LKSSGDSGKLTVQPMVVSVKKILIRGMRRQHEYRNNLPGLRRARQRNLESVPGL